MTHARPQDAPGTKIFLGDPCLGATGLRQKTRRHRGVYRTGRETVEFLDPESFKIQRHGHAYFTIKKRRKGLPNSRHL